MFTYATALTSLDLESAIVREPLVVSPETMVMEAIAQMSGVRTLCSASRTADSSWDEVLLEARSSCVIVVDGEQLLGIFTERDVVQLSAQQRDLDHLQIQDVMTQSVITLNSAAFTDIFSAITLLQQQRIRHLPIVDEHNRLTGLLTHESLQQVSRPIELLRLRQVSEVMKSEVVCAEPFVSMLEIAGLMTAHRVSSVVIVEERSSTQQERLQIPVGIVTERDVVQFRALSLNLETCLAQSVMSAPIFSVHPEDSLLTVQQVMEQRFIRRLAVLGSQGELAGIVTQSSLLQALNPLEIFKLTEILEQKVGQLEAEKVELLENRTIELEQQVETRTATLKATVAREKLLADLSTQIQSSLSLPTILKTTVDQVRRLLSCDRVNIWQFDNTGTIVVAESTDSLLSLLGEQVNDPLLQQDETEVYHQGQIQVISDIYTNELADSHRDLLIRLQTRAKIMVPLLCGNELWGMLNATESQHPRNWLPEEVELLQALSVQLAIALQQATIYQQLQDELNARRETEARLRESEQRYATLTAVAPVGIFRTNAEGQCIYVNNHWCDISGLSSEEAMGLGWVQGLHPDDRDRITREWYQAAQESRPFRLEYRFQRPDGTETWVYGQSVAEYDTHGCVVGYVGTITDISDRKRSEEALQNSEAHQRALIQAIPDLIMRVNRAGTYLEFVATPNFHVVGNIPQMVGTHVSETLPPDVAQIRLELIQRALETHSVQMYEQNLSIDGRTQIEEVRLVPYNDDEVLILVRDISDRKQAETALQNLIAGTAATTGQDFFPALVSHIAEALHVSYALVSEWVDQELHVLAFWANGALQPIFSYHLAHTPCERSLQNGRFYCETEVQKLFPDDLDLVEMAAQSYLGVALTDANGQPIGNLCILDQHFIQSPQRAEQILQVFAARAGAELERKRANAQLQQLNQTLESQVEQRTAELHARDVQLQDLFDNANDLIQSVLLSNGQFEYVNRAWREVLGYSEAEVRNLTIYDVLHPQCQQHCQETIAQMQAGDLHLVERIELTFISKSRQAVIVEGSINCRVEGDRPVATRAIFRDITARKQAEIAQRESQQLLQTVLDAFPLYVYWKDRDSVFLGCNQNFANAGGLPSPTDIVGKTDHDLIWGAKEAEIYCTSDRQVMESGTAKLGIVRILTQADGTPTWLEMNKIPLRDLAGNIIGVIGTFQDVSDRKQAEQTIHQQIEREALLREITQRIRRSLDLQTIFDTACQEIRHVLQADRVGIFKFYPEFNFNSGEFVAESCVAGFPSVLSVRVDDHCFGANYSFLYAKGKFHVIDDIYNNGMTVCHTSILAQFEVRANLVMPLLCGDTLWGLLCVHQCASARHWQTFEVNLTQQLATQLAIAIQQANLYEQIQAELWERQQAEARIAIELRRQEALGAIIQQIRESLEIEEILGTVTQQVKDVLHSDRVIVFRLFADGNSQIVEEAVSDGFPALKSCHWENEMWSQDILEYYWQGKPRIVPDVLNDVWTDCLVDYSVEGQIQSKIVAPILQDLRNSERHRWVATKQSNKLWGVLVVHACREKRVWQESEAQLLQQIANQLAIAIQQASLFTQLQQELTERQQTEAKLTESNQQLAVSNQELARATRLKDEFLANMSHELRTPLNAILGMTEGLQERVFGSINDRQLKALQTIERSGSHLLELINDILDVAKIESGQIDSDYAFTAIAPLCQLSLAFIKQQALKKRIQLEIKLQPHLPDLFIDERRIRQVLINLLNNAVKFTPEGGHITLAVSHLHPESASQPTQHFLRISVTDTGIGIAPENIQRLFQPFIQIDSALNRQYAGTGLGLALVKRIVELHGGRVGLTSELGVGSCFMVDLPYDSNALPSSKTSEPSATAPADDASSVDETVYQTPLILLAEDNDANVITISSYFKAKGYSMLLAKNGQEAIDIATAQQPDLILMDIQMPGMDGLEAIRQIRCDPNLINTPIVALTALAMADDRDRCLAAGATDYLAKPVKLKQLITTVQQLLAAKEIRP